MEKKTVYDSKQLQREIRHPIQRFTDFMKTKHGLFVIGGVYSSSFFLYQFSLPIYAATGLLILMSRKKFSLPIHLPIFSKRKLDFNNLKTKKINGRNVPVPSAPAGVVYVGNMQSTNEQVWWDKPLCCTHLFFLATTGGGKTFSFAGILANFVIYSGFCYSDAKADLGLIESYSRMMWRMGRINQLYVLSFQSGNRSPWSISKGERISHTFNPAANGSAPMISELFKSLMDGDGDIWAKRADNLSTVLIRPLTYMRDNFSWPMGFGQISAFFTLEKLGELCGIGEGRRESYPVDKDHKQYFDPLISFIRNLPGLTENDFEGLASGNKELISKISATVRDQLGYVTMQLVNVTNDLVGDYGHIFETMYGQINLEDALTNRKVVITLLPALERSESTMSVLGRITLAAQKTIVANAQAFKLQGELSDHIGSRPTAADVPFASVNDEAGSYMVEGVSANTAMARSANVSFWFGGQDLQAMKKRGGMIEKEIDTIWGTTVNKMAGSVLEEQTIRAFIEAADEEYRLENSDFELEDFGGFKRKKANRLTVQQRKVLTPRMLSNQDAGQVQLLTRGTVRALSLPNFVTPSLKRPVENFYITETIPIIPMDHEFLFIRKSIIAKMKTAIKVSANTNVFELALENMPDAKIPSSGVNKVLIFINDVMKEFANPAFSRLSFFTAFSLMQLYITKYCSKTLSSLKVKIQEGDESKLVPGHLSAVERLFGVDLTAPANVNESNDSDDEDDDDFIDEVIVSESQMEEARNHALSDENIDAFQRDLAAMMSGDDEPFDGSGIDSTGVPSEVSTNTQEEDIMSLLEEEGFDDSVYEEEKEPEIVAKVEQDADEDININFNIGTSGLVDIADLLKEKGVTDTEHVLISEESKVIEQKKSEVQDVLKDDLAALDAIRTYRPAPYKPSKDVIVDAISSLIESLNEEQ
jgi:hypothetical protein